MPCSMHNTKTGVTDAPDGRIRADTLGFIGTARRIGIEERDVDGQGGN